MSNIDYVPADMVLELVTRRPIHANEIKGCREVNLSGGSHENPKWKEGGTEKKHLKPHELIEQLLEEEWVVTNLFYKRDDGSTNYGHEPSINHSLVAVLVKIK